MAMSDRTKKPATSSTGSRIHDGFDLEALLHPAGAFAHPSDVVRDPDLTLNEKRAILASWASDACVIEAAPELRQSPAGTVVRFDDIMDALRTLDKQAGDVYGAPRERRDVRRRMVSRRSRGRNDQGSPLQ
jgi:hypothetical protein